MVVILLGSSFILYNLAAISGDPLEALRTSQAPNKEQLIADLTRTLQLDVPPPLRYFIWLRGVLGVFTGNFDLGTIRDGKAVSDILVLVIPTTIRLVFFATIIAIVLGIMLGIITALRQYSRFDYAMTFVAFLLFSLPIFWVAVLLKQFLAIQFNDFLADPRIPNIVIAFLAVTAGAFWASLLGGTRKRTALVAAIGGLGTAALLTYVSVTGWFADPSLGPIVVLAMSIGLAYGFTHLSTGLQSRQTLKASLTIAGLGLVAYLPVNMLFDAQIGGWRMFGILAAGAGFVAYGVSAVFAKIDRGATVRTSFLTAYGILLLYVLDKLMRTWKPYSDTDAVNGRPVPTTGQVNPLLVTEDYWLNFLDVAVHMVLPTIALTLISFAGYVRYSRGTLLEVLNQDYIRTARAKGLPERTVIMRHAFRNTMIPLTTIMVVDFAGIVGGAIITESVFGWIGMGTMFRQAITTFDLNLLMGVFLITGTLAVTANLVADLLYSALDPRIRVGSGA